MKKPDKSMYKSENFGYKIEVIAKKVYPFCPIYKEGDKMTIISPAIIVPETDAICLSFLADLIPYYRALSRGVDPKKMGLKMEGDKAFIECHDPGGKYADYPTDGGTLVFEIRRTPITLEDLKKYRKFDLDEMAKVWAKRQQKYKEKHQQR